MSLAVMLANIIYAIYLRSFKASDNFACLTWWLVCVSRHKVWSIICTVLTRVKWSTKMLIAPIQ